MRARFGPGQRQWPEQPVPETASSSGGRCGASCAKDDGFVPRVQFHERAVQGSRGTKYARLIPIPPTCRPPRSRVDCSHTGRTRSEEWHSRLQASETLNVRLSDVGPLRKTAPNGIGDIVNLSRRSYRGYVRLCQGTHARLANAHCGVGRWDPVNTLLSEGRLSINLSLYWCNK